MKISDPSVPNKTRTTQKDMLARCMAEENISVRHDAAAQTASFDVENRVLTLPVWKNMTNSVYDHLVGHEVAHALWTPTDGWGDFVGEGSHATMRHVILNVVEDARIERMIKDKFPGLKRDFANAYAQYATDDLFKIAGKDVNDLSILDRINLHFKLGIHTMMDVSFTSEEMVLVNACATTKTFDDVVEVSEKIFDLLKQEQEEKENEQGDDSEQGDESQGDSAPASGDDSSDSEQGDESDTEYGEGEDSKGEGTLDSASEDDTDDGSSAEGKEGDAQESEDGGQVGGGQSNSEVEQTDLGNVGSTVQAFDSARQEMVDQLAPEQHYYEMPSMIKENVVMEPQRVAQSFNRAPDADDDWKRVDRKIDQLKQEIKSTVNQMAQQFNMKMSADVDRRTSTAKTGLLDTVNMINHRWSEDIFLKNEIVTDGKSHGMVMFIDWSASMRDIIEDTAKQLFILIEFCRKVDIPYDVYAFSSRSLNGRESHEDNGDFKCFEDNGTQKLRKFSLLHFFSSGCNKRQHNQQVRNFWGAIEATTSWSIDKEGVFRLGCTPLNETIVASLDIVPEFKQRHGIDVVNAVFLTDGEGGTITDYYSTGDKHITDPKTRKVYTINTKAFHRAEGETMALLAMLKDRTGCNTIGIRLFDHGRQKKTLNLPGEWRNTLRWNSREEMESALKQYNDELHFVDQNPACTYDAYFIIKSTDAKHATLDDVKPNKDGKVSVAKIRNAFIKGGTDRKSARVIANKMADVFAH